LWGIVGLLKIRADMLGGSTNLKIMNSNKAIFRFCFLISNLIFFISAQAQVVDETSPSTPAYDTSQKGTLFFVVERMPVYKHGAEKGMNKFIGETIRYPSDSIKGVVLVSFWIDTIGKPTQIKLLKGISSEANLEAIRIVNMLEFNPAMEQGKKVSIPYNLPINFTPGFYNKKK
jgi:TonB family protein